MKDNKIDSFTGKYEFLSNFYVAPVVFEGLTYNNNEAAFQAQKCIDPKDRSKFTKLNPTEAKKLGREIQLRKDWEQIKIQVMRGVVEAKFTQNPELAWKLLDTGDTYLEEGNTWGDRIWGTVDGQGANNLGKILMVVRENLRQQETPDCRLSKRSVSDKRSKSNRDTNCERD